MVIGSRPSTKDVEFLQIATGNVTRPPKPSDLPEEKDLVITNIVDDQVIACGGYNLVSCYTYNFEDNAWVPTVQMDQPRFGAVNFVHRGKAMYILGGNSDSYMDSSVVYEEGAFRAGGSLPYPTALACVAEVNDTHVFYSGGESSHKEAYLLEVDTWTWTRLEDMAYGRSSHSCGKVGDNIVVVGGLRDASEFSEILSLESLTWSTGPGVPAASGYFAGAPQVLQLEDTFYIIGGFDNNAATDAFHEFDPESWTWKLSDEQLTSARSYAGIVPIPNRLVTGVKR